jgi:hypothetical protein
MTILIGHGYWIRKLGLNLVFTVVPEAGIERIYPAEGVPRGALCQQSDRLRSRGVGQRLACTPPINAPLMIGYRGRPLPIRYGTLGIEKVSVGEITRSIAKHMGW